MALQPTNLLVINAWQLQQGGTAVASKVVVCDICGGLFVEPGTMFFNLPHNHA